MTRVLLLALVLLALATPARASWEADELDCGRAGACVGVRAALVGIVGDPERPEGYVWNVSAYGAGPGRGAVAYTVDQGAARDGCGYRSGACATANMTLTTQGQCIRVVATTVDTRGGQHTTQTLTCAGHYPFVDLVGHHLDALRGAANRVSDEAACRRGCEA